MHRNSAGRLSYGKGFLGNMTGKSVRRLRAKPSGGLYAVFF
ncbi:hypothetical protein RUMCAL_03062 [Ruminococcus callidus ATCC 27760]|uniref:Uncharacterized protein n=1 Tax=Ruminococcus callidus ATCC 27760 TaxID=411473 RepID=U2LNT2_9FIRM|nr:hypothetical protein RUMCAL_03062 [Ruminococcus callidus ATCC 27760]